MASKIWVRGIATATLSLWIPMAVFGQARGGTLTAPTTGGGSTTGSTTGGTTTGTGATNLPGSTSTSPTNTPASAGIPQPIFISGRVMMEDGTPPSEPATIETVCSATTHKEGYTDSKGYFALELGSRNSSMIADASELTPSGRMNGLTGASGSGGPLGSAMSPERRYMGCELQARLGGYRSQTVPLAGRRSMDNPDVGTILMHRIGPAEEGNTVSAVSLAAPRDAKKAYDKGLEANKKKKFGDAQTDFEKAVEAYPKYATAWYELGLLQAGQGKMDMARSYFDKALECDPKYVQPYLQISILELQASHWQGLADATDKLVKLDPFDYPQAFYFNSVAQYNLHHFEAAEKSAVAAERLDTRHVFPQVSHLLGLILITRKDYAGAAEQFKTYLKLAPEATDAAKVRSQLAELEKVTAAMAAAKEQDR
jgi:tetratricopeptide (TPR) repeat protein